MRPVYEAQRDVSRRKSNFGQQNRGDLSTKHQKKQKPRTTFYRLPGCCKDAMPETAPIALLFLRFPRFQQVDRQWENDRGGLFTGDFGQRLQITQLDRLRLLR